MAKISEKAFLRSQVALLQSTCMEQRELIGQLREQLRVMETANRALRQALEESRM